ncbi:MAG: hypothetical protein E4G92_00040 [Bacteroidia bacterium]|nr:MAG: hypothetical protein E4G92_00040 [Bacteroidia bacterium]
MKKTILASVAMILGLVISAQDKNPAELTDQQVLELIEKHKPSKGGPIPSDIKDRLGATHMDGQYCFTSEPYIVEGSKKLNELGYGMLKLWFAKAEGNAGGYRYNSDWRITKSMTLKEFARHQYYKTAFDMPFSVFALNINDGFGDASAEDQTKTLSRIENEFCELTRYLLSEYKDRISQSATTPDTERIVSV